MLISIVLSVVFIYVFGQTNVVLSILNNLFIIASILLIIGGGFFVLQGDSSMVLLIVLNDFLAE